MSQEMVQQTAAAPPVIGTLADLAPLRAWADAVWPEPVRTMIEEGAGTGATVAANEAAWRDWSLRSRVLRDVARVDTTTTVLGRPVSAPILVAPSGLHTMVHPRGEVATAEGAARFGSVMVLSSGTGTPIEDVRRVGGRTWFQFYWRRDRAQLRELLVRAADLGCEALCLTADMPVPPLLGERMRHAVTRLPGGPPLYVLPRSAHVSGGEWDHDARLTWADLAWIRGITDLPLVVKGITTAEDALLAAEHGVDAVVVSNHGGRALDHARSSLASLVEVGRALAGRPGAPEILVDGGIRHGRDVLVALALGARAVLIGRPVLWGLAADGPGGVHDVLAFLRRELVACMAMAGLSTLGAVDRSVVAPRERR
jgi:4-hydroxymandelate oxidase